VGSKSRVSLVGVLIQRGYAKRLLTFAMRGVSLAGCRGPGIIVRCGHSDSLRAWYPISFLPAVGRVVVILVRAELAAVYQSRRRRKSHGRYEHF